MNSELQCQNCLGLKAQTCSPKTTCEFKPGEWNEGMINGGRKSDSPISTSTLFRNPQDKQEIDSLAVFNPLSNNESKHPRTRFEKLKGERGPTSSRSRLRLVSIASGSRLWRRMKDRFRFMTKMAKRSTKNGDADTFVTKTVFRRWWRVKSKMLLFPWRKREQVNCVSLLCFDFLFFFVELLRCCALWIISAILLSFWDESEVIVAVVSGWVDWSLVRTGEEMVRWGEGDGRGLKDKEKWIEVVKVGAVKVLVEELRLKEWKRGRIWNPLWERWRLIL